MAKTTRAAPQSSARRRHVPWWVWIAAPALATGVVAAIYVVYGRAGGDEPAVQLEALQDAPGVIHIHGLGVNPADGDLYAATHSGVFHLTKDGSATRIANRHQDTMGFTVVGPNHFLASGHPDLREDLPPLLGLLESRDAGKTWTKKSLLGKADFHALGYAHGTVYGHDSTSSSFMVSPDGRAWQTRSTTALRDFVVGPKDPDVILATTPNGLAGSADGGRTWTEVPSPPQPVLLDWERPDRLWLVDFAGRIHLSADGGLDWEARGLVAQSPEAFVAADGKLYVAAAGGIFTSEDEGSSWEVFYREGAGS